MKPETNGGEGRGGGYSKEIGQPEAGEVKIVTNFRDYVGALAKCFEVDLNKLVVPDETENLTFEDSIDPWLKAVTISPESLNVKASIETKKANKPAVKYELSLTNPDLPDNILDDTDKASRLTIAAKAMAMMMAVRDLMEDVYPTLAKQANEYLEFYQELADDILNEADTGNKPLAENLYRLSRARRRGLSVLAAFSFLLVACTTQVASGHYETPTVAPYKTVTPVDTATLEPAVWPTKETTPVPSKTPTPESQPTIVVTDTVSTEVAPPEVVTDTITLEQVSPELSEQIMEIMPPLWTFDQETQTFIERTDTTYDFYYVNNNTLIVIDANGNQVGYIRRFYAGKIDSDATEFYAITEAAGNRFPIRLLSQMGPYTTSNLGQSTGTTYTKPWMLAFFKHTITDITIPQSVVDYDAQFSAESLLQTSGEDMIELALIETAAAILKVSPGEIKTRLDAGTPVEITLDKGVWNLAQGVDYVWRDGNSDYYEVDSNGKLIIYQGWVSQDDVSCYLNWDHGMTFKVLGDGNFPPDVVYLYDAIAHPTTDIHAIESPVLCGNRPNE